MKVFKSKDFKPDFPEAFPWENIDSFRVSPIACDIAELITHELKTTNLNLVSGLRKSLNIIATKAELYEDEI